MSLDLLLAFIVFALVGSITPGPNNMMLLASGVNFGFGRTVPHLLGVSIGFAAMVVAMGFGLGAVFKAYPVLHLVLRYAGAGYLLFLAWKIATAGAPSEGGATNGRPITFLQAAAFQWVNPKAWVLAISAIATYTPSEGFFLNVILVAIIFGAVNLPCVGLWVLFGTAMRRLLTRPSTVRVFNIAMAAALVASLYPIFSDAWA
ncbi:MAG: LysE family translocator [Alphaproteobacteria bacterium]